MSECEQLPHRGEAAKEEKAERRSFSITRYAKDRARTAAIERQKIKRATPGILRALDPEGKLPSERSGRAAQPQLF